MKKITGVGVLLETPQGTYLFQERDHNTTVYPGKIAAFGGGIEEGEDVYACAKRELEEELGLKLASADLKVIEIFERRHIPGTYVQLFLAKDIHRDALRLQEGKSIVELSREQALQHKDVTDFTKEVLKTLVP